MSFLLSGRSRWLHLLLLPADSKLRKSRLRRSSGRTLKAGRHCLLIPTRRILISVGLRLLIRGEAILLKGRREILTSVYSYLRLVGPRFPSRRPHFHFVRVYIRDVSRGRFSIAGWAGLRPPWQGGLDAPVVHE